MSTHNDERLVGLLRQGWRGDTAEDLMREAADRIETLRDRKQEPVSDAEVEAFKQEINARGAVLWVDHIRAGLVAARAVIAREDNR